MRQNASNANVSLQPPFYIRNTPRLLHQALKSVHDWQLRFDELGGRLEAAMWASIWLRTHLREMGWAVHCLENDPNDDQSDLAFKRLWEASRIINDNLEVICTPPAVLMSMTDQLFVRTTKTICGKPTGLTSCSPFRKSGSTTPWAKKYRYRVRYSSPVSWNWTRRVDLGSSVLKCSRPFATCIVTMRIGAMQSDAEICSWSTRAFSNNGILRPEGSPFIL
jgi:hypothetical protein